MGKKRTFNDFGVRLRPKPTDYLVGFATRETIILEFAPTIISIIMAKKL